MTITTPAPVLEKAPKAPVYKQKMNPEIKTEWVQALKSGEYQQGKSALHRVWQDGQGSGFCCLGVLCKIGADKGVLEAGDDGGFRRSYKLKGSDELPYGMMPTEGIRDWAGLTQRVMDDLADMNDSQGRTFAEIADYIEENL